MRIVVLDYGSGNVRSAVRAVERVVQQRRLPASVELTADTAASATADALIVPGVGAFAACMAGLRAVGGAQILAERIEAGRPTLGICVGMQVLFESGLEHGVETEGLGLLPGRVTALRAPVVPHMGWNTVRPPAGSVLFRDLEAGTRFYFVHSYAVHELPADDDGRFGAPALVTTAEHGERFVAAVETPLVAATQFHPEKSGSAGQELLANWLANVVEPSAQPVHSVQ